MALSRVDGQDDLYVGGIWALRRSDTLTDKNITHVLSVVGFSPDSLKNFKDEPWSEYGSKFRHLLIDIDDVDDTDLLVELPRAVRFIHEGLQKSAPASDSISSNNGNVENALDDLTLDNATQKQMLEGNDRPESSKHGGVFVHCAAGKSRSVSIVVAYLLWRYPNRFDSNLVPPSAYGNISSKHSSRTVASAANETKSHGHRSRKGTAQDAVEAALALIRRTRPMAEPNDGFMAQLALWWEMGCPAEDDQDLETHPLYQRWAYQREVQENVAIGQAPSRLRFEDEDPSALAARAASRTDHDTETTLRCKKCRRTLATAPFINKHIASTSSKSLAPGQPCPHYFVEPLSWMRAELERGELNGRLSCPNERCGAAVGRYDWKGIRCACGGWVTPGLSLQRARVDEEVRRKTGAATAGGGAGLNEVARNLGIRMPPGSNGGGRGGHL